MELGVYVPRAGRQGSGQIDAASGIAGALQSDGRLLIYFEGNRHGAVNIKTFADRVRQAAGRMHENYPTIAKMWVAPEEFVRIGTWDEEGLRIQDMASLAEWLGVPQVEPSELQTS